MAGRKTKLTPELIKEAVDLVKMGNYIEPVCQYLGIHRSTWFKWMAEGEVAKAGLKKEFFDSIKRAESHAEIRNVQIIQKAADTAKEDPKLWVAAMTFLERKFPERWGRKDKFKADIEHSGKNGDAIQIETTLDLSRLTDQELLVLEQILEKTSNDNIGSTN